MPRKASGTSAKANAKGGVTANTTTTADGGGSQIFENQIVGNPNVTATANTTTARGGSAARGTKRRRTSNNVNSSSSGSEMYGSGTIVASNPFDDDNLPISAANHNISANNKMVPPTAANQLNMHPSMHKQATPPHLLPPQHHHHPHHHPHQQPPMLHHNQPMYSHPHQNNHLHYQHPMQQSMSLQPPHTQMGAPPNHLPPGSLPPHPHQPSPQQPQQVQQQMHSDHLGGLQQVQSMHNHGAHMMPAYGIPPPPPHVHPNHQQIHHPQPQHHQQQQQMIGSSTPPIMMGGPAPTHSPYNPTMHQGPIMQQPAMTPQGPPQQQQQILPLSHHQQIDPMNMQQPPHPASNHIGYCGKCQREVYRNEAHIICKAGCKSFFHISCSGLTQLACDLLMRESLAEWACDRCMTGNRRVPYIKYKT